VKSLKIRLKALISRPIAVRPRPAPDAVCESLFSQWEKSGTGFLILTVGSSGVARRLNGGG
jgi:hypothetical protein